MKQPKATTKRIAATIAAIALWPLTILIRKLNKAARPALRRAFRERNHFAYFALVLWPSIIPIAITLWVALTFVPAADTPMPWLHVVNRWLYAVLAVIYALDRITTVRRVWHRHFP